MPDYTDLTVARPEEGIALVTLNRPEKRNALRTETFAEIFSAMGDLVPDPAVRAIVLTGAGEKAFSAGADLSSPPGMDGSDIQSMLDRVQSMFNWMEEGGMPIIAALNGDAFGGGFELALACHFRLMARNARVGLTETNLGLMPAAGGTQRLVRLAGVPAALEMILLGKRIDAEEALRLGIAQRLSEPGKALADAMDLARALGKRAPLSTRGSIRAVMAGVNQGLVAGHRAEREEFAKCAASTDAIEGVAAFFEKREPRFTGA